MKSIILLVMSIILISSCKEKSLKGNYPDYDATLKIHLDAIQNHDLSAILSTVDDSVNLIFPNGQRMKSKTEFAAFHEDWFQNENWSMSPKIVKTVKTDSMSYSLIQYRYHDIDSAGTRINPRDNHLLLVFKLGPYGWRLIHDQNTRIQTD